MPKRMPKYTTRMPVIRKQTCDLSWKPETDHQNPYCEPSESVIQRARSMVVNHNYGIIWRQLWIKRIGKPFPMKKRIMSST